MRPGQREIEDALQGVQDASLARRRAAFIAERARRHRAKNRALRLLAGLPSIRKRAEVSVRRQMSMSNVD